MLHVRVQSGKTNLGNLHDAAYACQLALERENLGGVGAAALAVAAVAAVVALLHWHRCADVGDQLLGARLVDGPEGDAAPEDFQALRAGRDGEAREGGLRGLASLARGCCGGGGDLRRRREVLRERREDSVEAV